VRDQSNIGFSLLTSVILAGLLFQAANAIDVRILMPRLLELCVCYWVLSSPARVGIIFAFTVGVLISLIEGSHVGAASIGLSVAAYALLSNIYTIRQLDWISQSAVIFLLLGISVALQRVVLAAVGVSSDGFSYLIAVVISALLWRPFNTVVDTARFRIGQLL
jgi:rod shape-determining protein MreD